jgi:ABC-type molybdenum transport system ATPase subunit/photorepair protein PhrA
MARPKLLMLDEPSLGIAPKLVDEIYERLHALKSKPPPEPRPDTNFVCTFFGEEGAI